MFKTMLCALDGSGHAEKALALGADLASHYQARLVLLHVLLRDVNAGELIRFAEIEGLARPVREEADRLRLSDGVVPFTERVQSAGVAEKLLADIGRHVLESSRFEAQKKGVREVEVVLADGDPARRILECAEREGAECIVMGSRGLSDLKGLFVGSVSHKVTSRARCTCVTVK